MRPSDLADTLCVSRPSVTRAMAGLSELGLVRREVDGSLALTEDGHALGEQITRRDVCLTALFVEILGMPPEQADPQVHQLEHLLSDDALARLEVLVGHARSSAAWRKGLKAELARLETHQPAGGAFRLGNAVVHAGAPREKSEPSPDSER